MPYFKSSHSQDSAHFEVCPKDHLFVELVSVLTVVIPGQLCPSKSRSPTEVGTQWPVS